MFITLTFMRLIFNQKEDLLFKQNFYSFCSICKSKKNILPLSFPCTKMTLVGILGVKLITR